MKKITLIVPVYQVEKYLEECLQSVVAQTFQDFVCILVDDGSTDGSNAILNSYQANYPEVFRVVKQENRGLSGARNTGIELVKTKYIAFLDSDDIALPRFLEDLYITAEKEDADIVEGGFIQFYEDGREKEIVPKLQGRMDIPHNPDALCDVTVVAWNKLYKASLFLETGIRYPERLIFEDTGTTPRLVARSKIVYSLPNPIIRYRQRAGSIMSKIDKRVFDLYKIAEILCSDEGLSNYPEQRDACIILRIESLIKKLIAYDTNDAELLKAYSWLSMWNSRWRKNRVWLRISNTSVRSRVMRRLFEKRQITILRWIINRRKKG